MINIDVQLYESYSHLKELIKNKTGKIIPFSFRRDGDKYVFRVLDHHLETLNLSSSVFSHKNPWMVFAEIGKSLHKNE